MNDVVSSVTELVGCRDSWPYEKNAIWFACNNVVYSCLEVRESSETLLEKEYLFGQRRVHFYTIKQIQINCCTHGAQTRFRDDELLSGSV